MSLHLLQPHLQAQRQFPQLMLFCSLEVTQTEIAAATMHCVDSYAKKRCAKQIVLLCRVPNYIYTTLIETRSARGFLVESKLCVPQTAHYVPNINVVID